VKGSRRPAVSRYLKDAHMKILLVGPYNPDTPISSLYRLLHEQHEVRFFDPHHHLGIPKIFSNQLSLVTAGWTYFLRLVVNDPYQFANRSLLKEVRQFQPDLVFIISIQLVLPETISQIKKDSDAKVIGWFMDHIANFGRGYFFVSNYDGLFFKDKYVVDLLSQKLGTSRIHYLPQCCDPELHKPVSLTDAEQSFYGADLTIAGNLYYYRARMLEQFLDYDLKIWGSEQRWIETPLNGRHMKRGVYGLEKSKAMRAAKVVLNNNHYAEIGGINKRTFEVAGCGAFQVTDGPGLADVFEPGVEVVTFDTHKDLKEKVDYYLARPEERAEIARRAQKRAHAEHTYAHRWQTILQHLNEQGISFSGTEDRKTTTSTAAL
jgi:spore maturation protein CgeB